MRYELNKQEKFFYDSGFNSGITLFAWKIVREYPELDDEIKQLANDIVIEHNKGE